MQGKQVQQQFIRLPLAVAVATIAVAASQLVLVSAAHAQAATSGGRQIEEIVVTARKQEESAQDVPVSIIPLSDSMLKANQVTSLHDLPQIVPGLTVASNSQGAAPTLAIRAAKADNGTSDTVTAYLDDVPVALLVGFTNMLYDMQSISTLKGPQGTYFGTSTTGGAIIFRPNKPTNEFDGYLGGGGGDYDLWTTEGMINVPLGDTAAFRIAGEYYNRGEGFIENHAPGNSDNLSDDEHYSARAALRWQPTDALLSDTEIDYYNADNEIRQEVLAGLRPRYTYRTFLGGLGVPVDYAVAGITTFDGIEDVAIGPFPTWYEAEMKLISNTTSYEFNENLSIKNVLSWQNIETDTSQDNDTTVNPIVNGRTAHDVEQWTEEFSIDWATDDERVRNKTGVFFSNKTQDTGNHYRVLGLPFDPGPLGGLISTYYPIASISDYEREFDSSAIYSQFTVQITDTWTMTIGGRYTWDSGDYTASNRTVLGAAAVAAVPYGVFNGPYPCAGSLATYKDYDAVACLGHQDFEDSAGSGVLSFEGHFDQNLVYVSARHGYLVGGFNNQVGVPSGQLFSPEKVDDIEFGLKSDWDLGDMPVRTNVALFYGQYTDQQRVQNGQDPNTGATYIAVGNAGSTTFYGVDFDVIIQPTDNLSLTLGWNNVTAEYDEFNAPLNMPNVAVQYIDLEGEQAAQTPKNIFTASATYTWPIGSDMGDLSSSISYSWRDDTIHHDSPTVTCTLNGPNHRNPGLCRPQNITEDFTAFDEIGAYGLVNFSTSWNGVMGSPVDLRLWVKNLADEEYETYGSNQMAQYGYATYYYGDPRTIGLNVRYNF